ncbi:hypothetical protein HLB25_21390 [Dickeya dadantii]|uniref:hypothetical protein n=1 Tax=Dickeya dadantii TaxID=204038 RepID=UPI001495A18F|nr:hypothetical protein [Dickeya dadantii]NPE57107.1 hypothetical protein [Dickeya dadantii]NPE69063.1 hypothetical protein [Dickeya dadantii]
MSEFNEDTIGSDVKLTSAIHQYEELCESSRAQGREAKSLLKYIQNAINYRGMEYCTLTLAKFGSKRSLEYIRRGHVKGYTIDSNGNLSQVTGKNAVTLYKK